MEPQRRGVHMGRRGRPRPPHVQGPGPCCVRPPFTPKSCRATPDHALGLSCPAPKPPRWAASSPANSLCQITCYDLKAPRGCGMELEVPEGQPQLDGGLGAQPPPDLLAGNPRYEKVSGEPGAEGGDRAGPPASGLRGSSARALPAPRTPVQRAGSLFELRVGAGRPRSGPSRGARRRRRRRAPAAAPDALQRPRHATLPAQGSNVQQPVVCGGWSGWGMEWAETGLTQGSGGKFLRRRRRSCWHHATARHVNDAIEYRFCPCREICSVFLHCPVQASLPGNRWASLTEPAAV